MSEAFTKSKCFRDSDYITAEAHRTFGDHITARLQLVPEIDSRAKMYSPDHRRENPEKTGEYHEGRHS
jgi:hypothetical protein